MRLNKPYTEELLKIARRVVWYEEPEQALENVAAFLARVMVYGSGSDVRVLESIGSGAGRSVHAGGVGALA
jgi:hypothetical protein